MEILNKAETLRQALAMIGPTTSKKLEEFTGFPAAHVGALLARSASAGSIVRGWDGKKTAFWFAWSTSACAISCLRKEKCPCFYTGHAAQGC